jgi:tetratricopeptide (TPR) repeat protein
MVAGIGWRVTMVTTRRGVTRDGTQYTAGVTVVPLLATVALFAVGWAIAGAMGLSPLGHGLLGAGLASTQAWYAWRSLGIGSTSTASRLVDALSEDSHSPRVRVTVSLVLTALLLGAIAGAALGAEYQGLWLAAALLLLGTVAGYAAWQFPAEARKRRWVFMTLAAGLAGLGCDLLGSESDRVLFEESLAPAIVSLIEGQGRLSDRLEEAGEGLDRMEVDLEELGGGIGRVEQAGDVLNEQLIEAEAERHRLEEKIDQILRNSMASGLGTELDRTAEELELASQAIASDNLLLRAKGLWLGKRYEECVSLLDAMIEEFPEPPSEAFLYRAFSRVSMGDMDPRLLRQDLDAFLEQTQDLEDLDFEMSLIRGVVLTVYDVIGVDEEGRSGGFEAMKNLANHEGLLPEQRAVSEFMRILMAGVLNHDTDDRAILLTELRQVEWPDDLGDRFPEFTDENAALLKLMDFYAYAEWRKMDSHIDHRIELDGAMLELRDGPVDFIAEVLNDRAYDLTERRGPGDIERAIVDLTLVLGLDGVNAVQRSRAYNNRAHAFGLRGAEGDLGREIADRTDLLGMPDAPANSRALALVSRSFDYRQRGQPGDFQLRLDDLDAAVALEGLSADRRAYALNSRAGAYSVRKEPGDVDRRIADYSDVIDMEGVPKSRLEWARYYRASTFDGRAGPGDLGRRLTDLDALLALPDLSADWRARGLIARADVYGDRGGSGDAERQRADIMVAASLDGLTDERREEAQRALDALHGEEGSSARKLEELTRIIGDPATEEAARAQALYDRALAYRERARSGDVSLEIADCTQAIVSPGISVATQASALISRAVALQKRDGVVAVPQAQADYLRVVRMDGVSEALQALAWTNTSFTRAEDDYATMLEDLTSAIELTGATPYVRGKALRRRAEMYGRRGAAGDLQRRLDDHTAVIELPGATLDHVSRSLVARAAIHANRKDPGDIEASHADHVRLFEMEGVDESLIALALYNRSLNWPAEDLHKAIEDLGRLLELERALPSRRASALVRRGKLFRERGEALDEDLAIADFEAVLAMPDAPDDQKAAARRGLASQTSP